MSSRLRAVQAGPGAILSAIACLLGTASAGPLAPPLALPHTLRSTVQGAPADGTVPTDKGKPVDTLRALYPALAACWRQPDGLARFERTQITARFSLRRDGSVIGTPRITFAQSPGDTRARELLTEAALDAIARCTPVAVTPALGGAIAGRPLTLRFITNGPRGQGI